MGFVEGLGGLGVIGGNLGGLFEGGKMNDW